MQRTNFPLGINKKVYILSYLIHQQYVTIPACFVQSFQNKLPSSQETTCLGKKNNIDCKITCLGLGNNYFVRLGFSSGLLPLFMMMWITYEITALQKLDETSLTCNTRYRWAAVATPSENLKQTKQTKRNCSTFWEISYLFFLARVRRWDG